MLLLSQLGCWLFSALGVLDAAGCEELRRAEERLDALTWLKLLFVPTLGLLVIALFMCDEQCAHHRDRQHWNDEEAEEDGVSLDGKGKAGKRRKGSGALWLLNGSGNGEAGTACTRGGASAHAACKHEHSTLPQHSVSMSTSAPVAYTLLSSSPTSPLLHLLLLSDSDQPTAYTLPPSLPLRDLLAFHSSRHNMHLDPSLLLVFADGKRVDVGRLGEAVERLGVADGSVVRLEMDWRRMIELMMKEEERDGKERERETSRVRKERVELQQDRAAKLDASLIALQTEEAEVRLKYEDERREEDEVLAELSRAQSALDAARSLRVEAEDERSRREADSGSEREKREKARLTELIGALRKQSVELSKERTELGGKLRKVREEAEELSERRREMSVKADRIEREKEGWKRKVEQSEADVTARLHATEQHKEQSLVLKSQYENSQREAEEKRQAREETARATTHRVEQLDKDIVRAKERLAEAEREAVECAKFRQLSKQYEAEVKEGGRWKLLVKQGKLREKLLEKETKELVHWRQRAKAFEREVKQLRMWRREVGRRERRLAGGVDGLTASGWGGTAGYGGELDGLSGPNGMYDYDGGLIGLDGANGIGMYEGGLDDWNSSGNGGLLSGGLGVDDAQYEFGASGDELEDDEAAIPPVDVITHNALSHSTASSLAPSSASSSARLSGGAISSTLQPTAAPFVPRLHIAVPAAPAVSSSSSSSSSAVTSTSSPSSASTSVSSASSASSASSFAGPFYAAFGGVNWNAANGKGLGSR